MKLEDVRVGMILRDAVEDDWTVVGIDGGTLSVVSVLQPSRIIHGVKPDRMWPTAVGPAPAYDPPVEEPEPEAEAAACKPSLRCFDEWAVRYTQIELERDELKAKLKEAHEREHENLKDFRLCRAATWGQLVDLPRDGSEAMGVVNAINSLRDDLDAARSERDSLGARVVVLEKEKEDSRNSSHEPSRVGCDQARYEMEVLSAANQELKAKLDEYVETIRCCGSSTWCDRDPVPASQEWAGSAVYRIRQLRNHKNDLLAKVDDLKGKLSRAEKQAEQARKLWASWRDQKEALAALDAEFGGKP